MRRGSSLVILRPTNKFLQIRREITLRKCLPWLRGKLLACDALTGHIGILGIREGVYIQFKELTLLR